MNSPSSTGSAFLPAAPGAPAELTPDRLAEALAVILVDLTAVLPVNGRREALERLANRLDDRGRVAGGNEAAAFLAAVGGVLMRVGA